MLKLFKRSPIEIEKPVAFHSAPERERRQLARDLSTAYEVTEGNEEADWLLWEESVSFQDNQLQSAPKPHPVVTDAFDSVN